MSSHRWWAVAAAMLTLLMIALNASPVSAAGSGVVQDGTPAVRQGNENNGERPSFYGLVEQMPQGGQLGEWVIGGRTVVVTEQTQFTVMQGEITTGVCVKVHWMAQGSTTAHEIEREDPADCNHGGDDHGDDDAEVYGIVEVMPSSGVVGAWTVSSQVYSVTEESELKTEYGAFDIGRCVKIHLAAGATDTVREMETERSYKCNGGDDDDDTPPAGVIGKGKLYGELKSFPQELVGVWEVGVLTFTATTDTEFKTKNGPFTVGEIVKIEFYILQDGSFLAREIKTAMPDWEDDNEGDDEHHGNGHDAGRAFGMIEQLPANGLLGTWIIAGVEYSVTEKTELNAKGGAFAISETVKIEFKVDSNGVRVAQEIKLKSSQGAPGQEEATFVGFIDSMPDAGYVGLWVVNGTEFSATMRSKFKEDHGAFTVGAYVKVEYRLVNGERVIHDMETEVPPGAGDDDHIGEVESMDDSVMAAGTASSTWVIGGRSFVVTPSTRVSGALAMSDTAWVNSYVAAGGAQVATRIAGVTLDSFVYMPLTRR
ncbi:MAG: hypothetical protein IAE81_14355 [Caldilineaceae bacterium]|nr:hypothetical protein [Caldilineaceae bacterium]